MVPRHGLLERLRSPGSEPWLYLFGGAALAPLFLLPLPAWIGWYFAALVHEMGHAASAWALGCPAVPAIGIGEAVTVEAERFLPLSLAVWAGLSLLAWQCFGGTRRGIALGAVALGYPLLAFTALGELARLAAGHGAELTFAAVALWRASTGGFTSSAAERGLYSLLGWFLLLSNLRLSTGLVASASARADYVASGSFGCVNDYVRIAGRWTGGSLEAIGALATLAALAVLPLALLARRRVRSA